MDRSVRIFTTEYVTTGGQDVFKRDSTLTMIGVKEPRRTVIELGPSDEDVQVAIGTVCQWSVLSLQYGGTGERYPFKWSFSAGAGARSGYVLHAREDAEDKDVAARTGATIYLTGNGTNTAQVEVEYVPIVT